MFFFIPDLKKQKAEQEEAAHLISMRVKENEVIKITDLKGNFQTVKVTKTDKKTKQVEWAILDSKRQNNENKKVLFQAITDKIYLEKMMEILPLAGISKIYLFESDNSIKNQNPNLARLDKIVIRSLEQSEQVHKPELKIIAKNELETLIKEQNPVVLDCYLQEGETKSNQTLTHSALVGPEGGWSNEERKMFQKYKLQPVSLGQTILPAWVAGYTYLVSLKESEKATDKLKNLGWEFSL